MKMPDPRNPGRSELACSLAVLALLTAGCREAPEPVAAESLPQVTVAEPVRKAIVEWDRYTGRLAAVQSVEVRARISGYLDSVHFAEGEMIEKGQLLFVIDPRPFKAALNVARADLEEAKADAGRAEAQLRQAEAEAASARVARELARKRQARVERLVDQNAVAAEELDIRESEFLAAEADVEGAEAMIASARAEIANTQAAIETAQAAVERAELDLQYTEIRAPIAGRASDWKSDVGNLINGGSEQGTLLTTIVVTDPIHAYFDASEREVLKYMRLDREGKRASSRDAKNPVYLALADEQGLPHRGHMDFVDNRVDPNTGTIRGRAIFSNPDHHLVPGLFARLRIPGTARYEAVLVPDAAILTDQAEQFVLVVDEEDTVGRRIVETGPMSHGLRVVRSGLDGSERIVIRGLQSAPAGSQVTTVEGTIEAAESDGLPDDYQPVPRDQWLSVAPSPAPVGS